LRTLSLFELRMLPSHAREHITAPSVASIERLAGAAFVVSTDVICRDVEPGSTAGLAEWAETAADNVSTGRPVPPSPLPSSPVPTAASPAIAMEPGAGVCRHAIERLESEVQHVAAAVH
jgi:hypothetical protein